MFFCFVSGHLFLELFFHYWVRPECPPIFSMFLISSRNWDEFVPVSHYASVADLGGGNDPRIDLRAEIIPIGELATLFVIANTNILQKNTRNAQKPAQMGLDVEPLVRKLARFATLHEHPTTEFVRNFS